METAASLVLALACALAACGDASAPASDTPHSGREAGPAGSDAAPSDAPVAPGDDSAPAEGGAPAGDSTPPGPDLPPPPSCADECFVGQTRTMGGSTQSCALYSDATKSFVALGNNLRDRARRHEGWMRRFHLPNGYVAEVRYASATHDKAVTYGGYGDAAIWTGSYLAAEALRYQISRSPDALANVQRLVAKIDELFALTGHPGYMARFWAPTQSGNAAIDGLYKPANTRHHAATFKGQPMFWDGNTSRDQYQGVWLGWSYAYEALAGSPTHRELIRKRAVTIAEELMKARKQVPVTLRFKLGGKWQELPLKLDLQYAILNPTEYKNGGPFIEVGSSSGGGLEESTMTGLREFIPDLATVLKQVPILGALVPASVPRSGSAIMTASIFRIALQVTDGVAAYAARRAAIKAFYDAHIAGWQALAKQYTQFNDASQCWKSYYGFNIVFEPMLTLLRLERANPAAHAVWARDVLGAKMWPYVKDHKNVLFSYVAASHGSGLVDAAQLAEMRKQMQQFPEPPKVARPINNAGKYPMNSKCAGQTSVAVDVADRVMSDFIWQRQPFGASDGGDALRGYPGVDYLLAYWLGRRDGHLTDDNAGTCLRFK